MKEPNKKPQPQASSKLETRAVPAPDDQLREQRIAANNSDTHNTPILTSILIGSYL